MPRVREKGRGRRRTETMSFSANFWNIRKVKEHNSAYVLGLFCKKIMCVCVLNFKAVVFGLFSKTSIILAQLVSL